MMYLISSFTNGLNTSKLHKEILDSETVSNFLGLNSYGDELNILGDVIDTSGLNTLIENHEAESLSELKLKKIAQIDAKTQTFINNGFTFDNTNFSLSPVAQINWVRLKSLENLLTFPTSVTTKENNEYILTHENLEGFLGAGLGSVQYILGGGRTLKVAVNNCVTKEQVNAIVDNR